MQQIYRRNRKISMQQIYRRINTQLSTNTYRLIRTTFMFEQNHKTQDFCSNFRHRTAFEKVDGAHQGGRKFCKCEPLGELKRRRKAVNEHQRRVVN